MDEADEHPLRDEARLGGDHRVEEREVRRVRGRRVRVVAGDRVVGEPAQQVDVAVGGGVLEAADPQVAARDPGEHGAGQDGLAAYAATGRHHRERARRRDAEGVHRLADDVLPQHRTDGGQAVAAARERRAAGALEVQVAHPSVAVDELAEQERPTVAEAWGEAAELVAGVRLRHGVRAGRHLGAGEQPESVGAAERVGIETELGGQRLVEHEQGRLGRRLRLPRHRQLGNSPGEPSVQGDGQSGRGHHQVEATCRVDDS